MPADNSYTTPTATALASYTLLRVPPSCSSNHVTTLANPRDDLTFLANAPPAQTPRTDSFRLTWTHSQPENTTVQNNSSTNGAKKKSSSFHTADPTNSSHQTAGASGPSVIAPQVFSLQHAAVIFPTDALPPLYGNASQLQSSYSEVNDHADSVFKSFPPNGDNSLTVQKPVPDLNTFQIAKTHNLHNIVQPPNLHDVATNNSASMADRRSVHMYLPHNTILFLRDPDHRKLQPLSVLTRQRNLSEFCATARTSRYYEIHVPTSTKMNCFHVPVPYTPPVLPLPPKPGGNCFVCDWITQPQL